MRLIHKLHIQFICLLVIHTSAVAQKIALDHIWIKGTDYQSLLEAGFKFQEFDSSNTIAQIDPDDSRIIRHVGQGTESMVVRFHNIYIELIWVKNREILMDADPNHTLLDNFGESPPFGIGLRFKDQDGILPFESTSRWEPWMRPLTSIATAVKDKDNQSEPRIFVVPRYMRWDLRLNNNPNLLVWTNHKLSLRSASKVKIHIPGLDSISQVMQTLENEDIIEFIKGDQHLLEIEFDNSNESVVDLRPGLPLIIHY
jgi:hypothetical protein